MYPGEGRSGNLQYGKAFDAVMPPICHSIFNDVVIRYNANSVSRFYALWCTVLLHNLFYCAKVQHSRVLHA